MNITSEEIRLILSKNSEHRAPEENHAEQWRQLAQQERRRPSWDKHYLPVIAESKAKMFDDTALAIEKGDASGVPHCSCHLIPLTACAERARRSARR